MREQYAFSLAAGGCVYLFSKDKSDRPSSGVTEKEVKVMLAHPVDIVSTGLR